MNSNTQLIDEQVNCVLLCLRIEFYFNGNSATSFLGPRPKVMLVFNASKHVAEAFILSHVVNF